MRKALLISVLCLGVMMLWAGNASAFHDGGVAACNGCHTMHNSEDGQPVDPLHPLGNPWLLTDATPSDVCLSCHSTSGSRGVWAADPMIPGNEHGGGDFVFNVEDNINDGHNGGVPGNEIPGYKGGHTPVELSRSVQFPTGDPTLPIAPGGTFNSQWLGCSSCHDPHGNEHFRLLHSVGEIQGGLYTFTAPAPDAIGMTLSCSANETNSNHTAYKSGVSEWCGNCHGDFHNTSYPTTLKHPSGAALGGDVAAIYDAYNGTADYTGGQHATAYLKDVPFEDPAAAVNSTVGPTFTSKVMCLSCHRSHATSAPNAGRWDFDVTLLSEDGEESGSYAIPDPYNYTEQRSLCNKCHVKDEDDEGSSP